MRISASREELLARLPSEFDDLMLTMRIERALAKLRKLRDSESKASYATLLGIYEQRLRDRGHQLKGKVS